MSTIDDLKASLTSRLAEYNSAKTIADAKKAEVVAKEAEINS